MEGRMKVTATHRSWAPLLLLTALLVLGAGHANAQVNPLWDHYKLYVAPPIAPALPPPVQVRLFDEFGLYDHQVLHLAFWMNPVEKTVFDPVLPATTYPINTPFLHYTWWQISPQFNEKLVAATNQFGDQTLYVKDALFLLNPALKNQQGTLPQFNHYKCYACEGQPINKQVALRDQFDVSGGPGWTAVVTYPRWFCNPTSKSVYDPLVGAYPRPEPVLDPNQHYICYEYQPQDPAIHPLVFSDEFNFNSTIDVGPSQWLCVPTYKNGFTPTTRGTWGKLKTLYR
jgi:hypothetical protein